MGAREVVRCFKMVAARDVPNIVEHGLHAPRWEQLVWVDPKDVRQAVRGIPGREWRSGQVVDDGWLDLATPIDEVPKVNCSVLHWRDSVPWELTGIFEYMLDRIERGAGGDGCRNIVDLRRRYAKLDEIFVQVSRERRLRSQRELMKGPSFRGLGEIRVHIGPDAEPIFGGAGAHRLAMAQVLGLDVIPARVGLVHPSALASWQDLASGGP